jgi:sugar phosphate isomerase/epimerase
MMQGRILPATLERLQVFPADTWREEFSTAKELGFDGVELLYDLALCPANPLTDIDRRNIILRALEESGIRACSICADYLTGVNLKDENDPGWLHLSGLLKYAMKINADVVVVPFFNKNNVANSRELCDLLNIMKKKLSGPQQRLVSIEANLPAEDILDAVESSGSDINVCYDTGNATACGYNVSGEIELLGDMIGHVHIKDRRKNDGPNVPLGSGDTDFKGAFSALARISYCGGLTLETAIGDKPAEFAVKHLKFTRECIEKWLLKPCSQV